jgi:hypothetical protein
MLGQFLPNKTKCYIAAQYCTVIPPLPSGQLNTAKDPLTPYRVLLDVRRWSRAYTRQAGSGACTREERSLGHGSSTSSQCESREGRRGGNTARWSEEMRQNLAALSGSPAWPGSVQYSEARPPSTAASHTTAPPPPFIYLSTTTHPSSCCYLRAKALFRC